MIRRLMKSLDAPRMWDHLLVLGGRRGRRGGLRMADGSQVPVELIMQNFGVSREEATKIQRQVST